MKVSRWLLFSLGIAIAALWGVALVASFQRGVSDARSTPPAEFHLQRLAMDAYLLESLAAQGFDTIERTMTPVVLSSLSAVNERGLGRAADSPIAASVHRLLSGPLSRLALSSKVPGDNAAFDALLVEIERLRSEARL